ncbi:MAG: hypothetical protein M1444_01660 [Patescibacteria group bacterium]|nr:hypothetical protein [Patescibacteria group bacterium]
MNGGHEFSFNSIDRVLLVIVSSFLINGYLLWFISNVTHINDLFIWFLTIPASVCISYFTSKRFHFHPININRRALYPYILLFLLLILSAFYLFQPMLSNPYASFGIPNKDLHDGIASFISLNGFPPQDKITAQNAFIPNSQNGLYLGYPNGLHVLAGFFDKLGVFEFHSSWVVIAIALLITSISIFLISKAMLNNIYYSAVIAGLFAFSSFRLSYAMAASIPMLFSFALVVPSLLICLFTIYNKKDHYAYIISSVSIALLAASYAGTIFVFAGFFVLFAFLLVLKKDRERLINLLYLILFSLPLLFLTFLFQQQIYWENTFPTALDYDPYELSQRLPPLDKPVYMIIYSVSMILTLAYLIKNRAKSNGGLLKVFLFLINLGFLAFIPYDFLFHRLNNAFTSDQLVRVDPNGFFGGLNHQKISRLALLQPFFFIFFLGQFSVLIKKITIRIMAVVIVILLCLFIRFDLPLYPWIAPEILPSFYNPGAVGKPYTLLSDMRLVVNDQIWSKDIIDGLDYLRFQENRNDKVLVWDDRNWTEETIAGWSSGYLQYRVLKKKDLGISAENIDAGIIKLLSQQLSYIFVLYPTQDNLQVLRNTGNLAQVWNRNDVFIFKIQQ